MNTRAQVFVALLVLLISCARKREAATPDIVANCIPDLNVADVVPFSVRLLTLPRGQCLAANQGMKVLTPVPVTGDAFQTIPDLESFTGTGVPATFVVRLAGIRAPTADPWRAYARECLTRLALLQSLRVETGDNASDRWGNTWAYVIGSSSVINVKMVALGWAKANPTPSNGYYDQAIAAAEKNARAQGRGVWSPVTPPPLADNAQ